MIEHTYRIDRVIPHCGPDMYQPMVTGGERHAVSGHPCYRALSEPLAMLEEALLIIRQHIRENSPTEAVPYLEHDRIMVMLGVTEKPHSDRIPPPDPEAVSCLDGRHEREAKEAIYRKYPETRPEVQPMPGAPIKGKPLKE